MRNTGRFLTLALCAVTMTTITAGSAHARSAAQYRIEGRGWGHGIGMSQYGAAGYAARGWTHQQIISHYFTGTVVAPKPANSASSVRVLLQSHLSPARIQMTSAGFLKQGATNMPLTAGDIVELQATSATKLRATRVRKGRRTVLSNVSAADTTIVPSIDGGAKVLFQGDYAGPGTAYRGTLTGHLFGGKVSVFNTVPIESYLRGVVPDESIPSWPQEALRAQAVAARSYALTDTSRPYDWFDLYSTTTSQVYGGVNAEEPTTDEAVAATANMVARVGGPTGEMARTFFHSTSAGRTATNEDVWGSAPYSYLRSVESPYEDASPYFTWKGDDIKRYTPAQLGAALGYSGVRSISNTVNPSGYAKDVNVVTAGGTKRIPAPTVQQRLELRSTYFRINLFTINAANSVPRGSFVKLTGRAPIEGGTNLLLRQNGVTRAIALKPTGPLGAWTVRARVAGPLTATLTRSGIAGPAVTVGVR